MQDNESPDVGIRLSPMEEEWRPVVGFANFEVSNLGRVRNAATGRIKQPSRATSVGSTGVRRPGDLVVGLWNGSGVSRLKVGRLVLEAFVGPCPPGKEMCHGNRDKMDCSLANLRWGTHAENMRDERGRQRGE
jgi:hypothetical protein